MRKVGKILLVVAIILAFIITPQTSFAFSNTSPHRRHNLQQESKIRNLSINTSGYTSDDISKWSFTLDKESPTKLIDIVGFIIRVLRNISIFLTVLVITILGIKYMIGSVEQKADYKKAYINIIIGVAVITLVTSVIDAILSVAQL